MIPKRFRGIARRDIVLLARSGGAIPFSGGVVRWKARRANTHNSRFAVAVSGRIAKRATKRAAIRRVVQAAILDTLPSLRPPSDVLVVWNRSARKPSIRDLQKEFTKIFSRIR